MESKLEKVMEYYRKSYVYGKIYEDRYRALEKLKEHIDVSGFYDIYVKNIGGEELNDEVYLFSKSLIVKLSFQLKANGVYGDYKVYRTSEISNVRLIDDVTYESDVILDIEFKGGKVISIDNRECSDERDEDYEERQKEVSKAIIEAIFKDILATIS